MFDSAFQRYSVAMFPLLETLIAVYETGQFTLAADELKISQSTVSSRIAALERMVGAQLFVRNAKSDVTATEAGRMLYQTAIRIGGDWHEACESIARAERNTVPLNMLFSHTSAVTLLPVALRALHPMLGRYDCSVDVRNSDAILEQVGLKAVQFGVVEKPIINESVERVTLCEDELVLAGNSDDVWLMREAGSGVRYYTELFCKMNGIVPRHVITISSNSAIVAMLEAGVGCSVVSRSAVSNNVRIREIGREFKRRFYALIPRSGLGREQRDVIDVMVAAMQSATL